MTVAECVDTEAALIETLQQHYGQEVLSLRRVPQGMGTVNWRVLTAADEYFLKQYPPGANLAGEEAALKLSQSARAAGIPAPLVISTIDGRLLWSEGDLAFALFEYVPGATSGLALSRAQMAQAGNTLGRLHEHLRTVGSAYPDISDEWLLIDEQRKRAQLEGFLRLIADRPEQDDFDRRTAVFLQRRIELLPTVREIVASLPPLSRQVLHGDYSVCNVLFRGDQVVAVVDFRPPELFLPAFEIGRIALSPETMTAGPWLDKAVALIESYCAANLNIPRADVEYAPHVWAIQLVRSEYGVRQHYVAPLEYQSDLDRFWFERCEAAELILQNLTEISEAFASAWEQRRHDR